MHCTTSALGARPRARRTRPAVAALAAIMGVVTLTAAGTDGTALAAAPTHPPEAGSSWRTPPGIEYYYDFGVQESRRPHAQWSLRSIRAREAWRLATGRGVTVALVDSGIGPSRELDGRAVVVDFVTNRDPARRVDRSHHGTAVASVLASRSDGKGISGVAPQASLLSVRVFDVWSAPDARIIRAIRWAADHGADVLNLSLTARNTPKLRGAIRHAISRGVIVVAGAGNDGVGSRPRYPAAYPEVIAVGAITRSRERAELSSTGKYVDVAAPGEEVLASDPGNTLSWYSGTSLATPHVAGVVALMLEVNPRLTQARAERILRATARDLGSPGKDTSFGYGLIDARAAVVAARRAARD